MFKHTRFFFGVAGVAVCALGAAAESTTATVEEGIPPIIVQDAEGKPISNAEAAVINSERRILAYGFAKADAEGQIRFKSSDYHVPTHAQVTKGDYELLVLARGKAPLFRSLELPSAEPVTVQPADGTEVEVTVTRADGKPLPAGVVPRFYPQPFAMAAWPRDTEQAAESAWPEPLGSGKFRIELTETTTPWRVLIHDPKVVRGFEEAIETTSALAQGKLTVKLPETGSLSMGLEIPEKWTDAAANKEFALSAMMVVDAGGENRMYFETAKVDDSNVGKTTATVENLVPGQYWTQAYEIDEKTRQPKRMMNAYSKGASVKMEGIKPQSVSFTYKEADPSEYRGDGTAEVTVLKQGGSPAAGEGIRISIYDRELSQEVLLTSGTLSDAGTTKVQGLKSPGAYTVSLAEDRNLRLGSIRFKEGEKQTSVTMTVPPKAGDMAPDITLTDISTSETVKLSDFRGQVVFLDFWATWCGPCQQPMEHNQQLMAKNAEKWKDKAVILGASVDDTREVVEERVKSKGWTAVRQLWCGKEDSGNPSDPQQAYGITSIPTVYLIDTEGKIVKRGHPAMFEVEEEIDALVKKE